MVADLYSKEVTALLSGVIWVTRENLNLPKKPKKTKFPHFPFQKNVFQICLTQIRAPVQIYPQSPPHFSQAFAELWRTISQITQFWENRIFQL
jgi:hypothetical protein